MNLKRHRTRMVEFFERSDAFDYTVTRPLSHIAANWELTWIDQKNLFEEEEDSFASHVNDLIEDIARSQKPSDYHTPMNVHLFKRRDIKLVNKEWVDGKNFRKLGVEELGYVISQESIIDTESKNLVLAAAGRIETARKQSVFNYDDLDDNHMGMLAQILISILYGRYSDTTSTGQNIFRDMR